MSAATAAVATQSVLEPTTRVIVIVVIVVDEVTAATPTFGRIVPSNSTSRSHIANITTAE